MPMPPEAELETFDYTDFGVGIRYLAQQLVDDDWIPDAVLDGKTHHADHKHDDDGLNNPSDDKGEHGPSQPNDFGAGALLMESRPCPEGIRWFKTGDT